MRILLSLIESIALVSALSVDSLASGFAYGVNKVKIPLLSNFVMNIICSLLFGVSLLLGDLVQKRIPGNITKYVAFFILIIISFTKFFDFAIRMWIKKSSSDSPTTSVHFLSFKFIIKVILDPVEGDSDHSKTLSVKESIALAIALSIDGIAVGFGSGMTDINILITIVLSFIIGMVAILVGCSVGNKIARAKDVNLSWVGGAVLLLLAISKIV